MKSLQINNFYNKNIKQPFCFDPNRTTQELLDYDKRIDRSAKNVFGWVQGIIVRTKNYEGD